MMTPYYLIDKAKLRRNMERISYLREKSGAKALLALKCFAAWSVFEDMRPFMDGTTSSSLNEVRLLTLCRVRQAISGEIQRLSNRVPGALNPAE